MATIGQQLSAPEAGWKRYDDTHPAIKYEGGAYTYYSIPENYNGSETNITQGAKAIFIFKGTKLRILGTWYSNRSRDGKVYVDGVLTGTIDQYLDGVRRQALSFHIDGLEDDFHEIELHNDHTGSLALDAIDIDSTGRLLHPDEVLIPDELTVGKRIRCHYTATSNVVGTFSGLGQETSDFIPPESSATPNGDFYFLMVDEGNGVEKLIADRNIQHSISWDSLNSSGISNGKNWKYNKDWPKLTNYFTFDESSGNVTDLKGTAVGTVTGATRTTGWNGEGNALNFDGNDYVQFNQKVLPVGAKSIRFKIKTNDTPNNFSNILDGRSSSGGLVVYISPSNPDKLVFSIKKNDDDKLFLITTSTSINDGRWHDVLFTWDGTTEKDSVKLYVDNMNTPDAMDTALSIENMQGTNLTIGKNSISSYLYFKGQLDELEIYNDVINPVEELPLDNFEMTTRLLTGGVSSTDKDNEWDKYIVGSTLNGAVSANDMNVWNYSIGSWTSTTNTSGSKNRTVRGNTFTYGYTPEAITTLGFRPVLLIETLLFNKKSFISFNGEYRKFIRKNLTKKVISPKLTEPNDSVSSSSNFPDYETWKAFNSNSIDAWSSTELPSWIMVDCGRDVSIGGYSITSRNVDVESSRTASPKSWTFEGSNDGVNWNIISVKTGQTEWSINEKRVYSIAEDNISSFRYHRLKFTNANGHSIVMIGEIELFESEPHGWQTVSTTLPSVDTFKEEGMDDLSVFDRKQMTFIKPMDDNTTSGEVLGNGKVFKEKVNLKKYFDLIGLNVK